MTDNERTQVLAFTVVMAHKNGEPEIKANAEKWMKEVLTLTAALKFAKLVAPQFMSGDPVVCEDDVHAAATAYLTAKEAE